LNSIFEKISSWQTFIKNNPQIVYTMFLLIIIPLALLFSGQKFLDVAKENQEQSEREHIGLMQDVFVSSVHISEHLDREDHAFLQEIVEGIKRQNPSLSQFKVLLRKNNKNIVVASLNKDELSSEDKENEQFYNTAGTMQNRSFLSETFVNGKRHWKAARAMIDGSGEVNGFVFTDSSMSHIDESLARNVKNAYYVLLFIILAIFLLLIRQTKIINYAVLYKRLKSVDKMKDDFISMAAHELKTPLAAIQGHLELLSSSQNFSENGKNDVNRINVSIKRLNKLVGDMLDVARIQQGRMKFSFKKINPSEVMQSVVDSFQRVANEKGIEFHYSSKCSAQIFADSQRLEQVFINLVSNAIKYTQKGSVNVTMDEEHTTKGDFVRIRVSDTGVGMSKEEQKKLFKRFSRIRTKETADIDGTGLGLWIVAHMVSVMKGNITIKSNKGEGSSFIVSFPIIL